MSKVVRWIGDNLSLGGLLRNAGSGVGKATKFGMKGAGAVASMAVKNPDQKAKIKSTCDSLGEAADSGLTKASAAAGNGLNVGVQKVSAGAGFLSGKVFELAGASEGV